MKTNAPKFIVATPGRSVCDDNARVLLAEDQLRFIALGTRRGTTGIPPEHTHLLPAFGLLAYGAAKILPAFAAESFRFRLHPWFDRWVARQMQPGDHVISSYGYANECFRRARATGGRTFLDGGNSHPEHFWEVLLEEHRRWQCPDPPVARHHFQRSCAMMADVDFVLSPSRFVTRSFLDRGFREDQIIRNVYPLDLDLFRPRSEPRPADRSLTVISTGSLSLRKGTPYLLAAFRLVLRTEPNARLLLTDAIADSARPILEKYRDLPIDWSPSLPHAALAERLQRADVFVLPSLEDGFARTVAEALACGLPVITTPNTGASDLIEPGRNGSIIPIRDPEATASAILEWGARVRETEGAPVPFDSASLAYSHFAAEFSRQLRERNLLP